MQEQMAPMNETRDAAHERTTGRLAGPSALPPGQSAGAAPLIAHRFSTGRRNLSGAIAEHEPGKMCGKLLLACCADSLYNSAIERAYSLLRREGGRAAKRS